MCPTEWIGPRRRFHDRHHAFQYLVGCSIGALILLDPSLIESAWESLERSAGDEPQRAHIQTIWSELLRREPAEIAHELGRNDARGDLVRQTRPPFIALPAKQRAALIAEAHRLVAVG